MGLAKSNNNVLGIDKDFFTKEISDNVSTKGFIQTSAQDVINWARTGSLHWMTFGLACCACLLYTSPSPRDRG